MIRGGGRTRASTFGTFNRTGDAIATPTKPTFFRKPAELRAWFQANHDREPELLVGFYKVGSGRASISWPESVSEALCFGWIDGVRRRIDEESYSIRFTPRKSSSIWSAVNIRKMEELVTSGLVHAAGAAAYARRTAVKSAIYSYENKGGALSPEDEKRFRRNRAGWKFFGEMPEGYQRVAIWWVISAKRPETRAKRLDKLILLSERRLTLESLPVPAAAKKR